MIIELPKTLEKDIMDFCNLNNITEVNSLFISIIRKGFNLLKYGNSPIDNFKSENKPLTIEEYHENTEEKLNVEGRDEIKPQKVKGGKHTDNKEESIKSVEKEESTLSDKPKKRVRIIKN